MKNASRIFALVFGIAMPVVLCSCETTGDPRQGGLFGWSESQAQDRIYQREAELNAIKADTDRQRGRSQYLEGRLDQAERDADLVR